MSKKVTTEDFIKKAREKHGDKYDYSNAVYVKSREPVNIFCRKCKIYFPMTPNAHTSRKGKGCSTCNGGVRHNKSKFVENARSKYGDKFSYDKVVYVNARTDVKIFCKTHNYYFETTPDTFLSKTVKHGCSKCANDFVSKLHSKPASVFLKQAIEIHGDKYAYDLSEYKSGKSRIKAICRKHGDFTLLPSNHIMGKGCRECGKERSGLAQRITKEQLIEKIKSAHGDEYEYDLSDFTIVWNEIRIKCKKHGWFPQVAVNHYRDGNGCPSCSSSKGEKKIRRFLESNRTIIYKHQYKIDECKNIYQLPFDFAILSKNKQLKGLIEFHGIQHYIHVQFFHKTIERFNSQQKSDQIKADFCKLNKIPLLIIPYNEIDKIPYKVGDFLKRIKSRRPITELRNLNQINIFQF